MVRKISALNKKVNDLRNLMEVVLDANPFTQPITILQTGAASAGSSKCMGFFHKLYDISGKYVCFYTRSFKQVLVTRQP